MIRTIVFLLTLSSLLFLSCKVKENKSTEQKMDNFNYDQAWQKVNELEKQGLAKTMFKKVLEIHEAARKMENGEQLIKSLVYQGKYYIAVEEDGLEKTIDRFEEDMDQIDQPEKSILQSMLAELYDIYLTQHLWKIGNRIPMAEEASTDIRNWTAQQFVDKSTALYLASVSHGDLAKTPIDNYTELIPDHERSVDFRNSILDILGQRAINYFSQGKSFLSESPERYILKDEALFETGKTFLQMDFSEEHYSRELQVLVLFQNLLQNKINEKNKAASLDLEINKLQYIRKNFIGDDKDVLYLTALQALKKEYKGQDGIAEVNYYLAEHYYNNGKKEEQATTADFEKAYQLCRSTIQDFPDTYGAELCKGLLSRIESKQLSVVTEMVNLPGEHLIAKLDYKNVQKVYLKVVELPRRGYEELSGIDKNGIAKFISSLLTIQEMDHELPAISDFNKHAVEIALPALEIGAYALAASDSPEFDPQKGIVQLTPFFVSNLAYWHSNIGDQQEIHVVDRTSGSPVEGVKVKLFQWEYRGRERFKNLVETLLSDDSGLVRFSNVGNRGFNYTIELETEEESVYYDSYLYAGQWNGGTSYREKVLFFLDRVLYRPGQTVYYKALLIKEEGGNAPEIIPFRKDIRVELTDVNRQKLEESVHSTNEFGSFSGSFTLPETGLTGKFSLMTDLTRDRVYFNVEAYKRPQFFVELEDFSGAYKLNDEIEIKGKAITYGGVNISNSKVVYRVMRKSYFPYWSPYNRPYPFNTQQIEIANGIGQTNAQGEFSIAVKLLADDQVPKSYRPYFHYEIYAEVIDPTGESHFDRLHMQAGWTDLDVQMTVEDQFHQDSSLRVELSAKSWNGKDQKLEGSLSIYRLKSPDRVFRKRFWAVPDQWLYTGKEFAKLLPDYSYQEEDNPENWTLVNQVANRNFDTEKQLNYDFNLEVGEYKIELTYRDSKGVEQKIQRFSSVISDQHLSSIQPFRFIAEGGEPGQAARILLQTQQDKTKLFLELFEKETRSIAKWESPSSTFELNYPIEEKHRGNFHVRVSYVFNNRFHTQQKTILVPWSNKELAFEYLSFRDKMRPGSEEKWIIKVTGKKKDAVMAEVLATMYDASLDDIIPHQWQANIFRSNYLKSRLNYFGFGQSRPRSFVDHQWNEYYYPGKTKKYKTLNWFGLEHIPGYRIYREDVGVVADVPPSTRERMMSDKVAAGSVPPEAEMDGVQVEAAAYEANESPEAQNEADVNIEEEGVLQQQAVRSNLNETVFFYPHLKTDEEGNVLIEFTMNEALTKWKFMALAHTAELKIGISTREVMTQKELMIRPNAPRFVRLGDELELSASASNLSDQALSGEAEIRLYDALSLEDITAKMIQGNTKQTFDIQKEENIGIRWSLRIPENSPDLIQYKFFARSGPYTDGEAGYLPVLSNRVLVTETLPMWVGADEQRTYTFEAMDKLGDQGLKTHRFTLESTSNPIWYAIQAMPYIRDYRDGNSVQLVNALYANLLAAEIIRQNPKIERVFRQWKEEAKKGDESLQSNLQRNEELKQILLKETPWLLDALDESEQKRNIALLFDRNQVAQDQVQIMSLLKNLQRYDGGFSWFSGGRSSEYLTLYVLNILGKLKATGIPVESEAGMKNMIRKAILFCDQAIADRYAKLLKRYAPAKPDPEKDYLGSMDVLYLYTRSMFDLYDLPEKTREAKVFYLNQAADHFLKKSLYLQGMIALSLHNNGNSTKAKEILTAVEERSIYKEELGRYWKQMNGFHWTEFPLETQALLIDAFLQVMKNETAVEEMQIWLLKHKQTNRWKTPRASIAAIHALLINKQELLDEGKQLKLRVGGEKIEAVDDQEFYSAGSGYFKKNWEASEVEKSMATIELENPNDHIAWGAAYWQYFQDIDKVKSFEDTPLSIQKALYRSTNTKSGEELVAIKDGERIEPGTKVVVRLRIEVDRAMDFVRLDDQRAVAFEPLKQVSAYRWSGGLYYYEAPGDSGTSFFIEHLSRGVYIIEYPLRAVHSGTFISGLATIQSMYAPEFSSHSDGGRVFVE
jgi:hypothetical protein